MKLLQICNVGTICGGTGACAWSVTRALSECEHHVAFLSRITEETRAAFEHVSLRTITQVDSSLLQEVRPDVLILHNTHHLRVHTTLKGGAWRSIQYLHSVTRAAEADETICCSHWLAGQMGMAGESVVWQGVPRAQALRAGTGSRSASALTTSALRVGRICTPVKAKWAGELVGFYGEMSRLGPEVWWEFVGCPGAMQGPLAEAVRGRVTFHRASWEARSLMLSWDVLLHCQPGVTESFGRTVAEALRVGCVPVVDARGGFCEQVVTGTGYLCETTEAFVAALWELANAKTCEAMKSAARRRGENCFSLEAFGERLRARLAG